MSARTSSSVDLYDRLLARGISRRTFLKFCGGVAAAMGLSATMAPRVARAIETMASSDSLVPVIWLEGASCSGCTESLAQIGTPDVGTILLEIISLNYSETLSAGAGTSLEQVKEETIDAGNYILVFEGAVITGWEGNGLRIAEEKGTDILAYAARNAVAVIAAGSCAVDGGWVAAYPNPAGAIGVQQFLQSQGITTPVVNIPACPVNPENFIAVLMKYVLDDQLPALDAKNMPAGQFGQTIHDNCPRRGHFENGEFVYRFGSQEEADGYCLYAMGCRGPQTYSNCPETRWNQEAGWCVEAGAPCCGCASANPGVNTGNWVNNNAPFMHTRFRDLRVGDLGIQPDAVALGVTGVVAAAIFAHAYGMKAAGRTQGGAPIETETDYERKHRQAGRDAGAAGAHDKRGDDR